MRRQLTALITIVFLLASIAISQSQPASRSSNRFAQTSRRQTRERGTTYQNPIFNEDFPDPTVMRASDDWYYAYATQTVIHGGRTINIQVARSRDLINWERLSDALPIKPAWASETQKFWAPDVIERAGTFYMYYSAEPNTRDGLCLAVATARSPRGPFTDSGRPLQCGEGFVNIDPMAFDDPRTGRRLLYWGSGFQPIKVQELAPDRLSFLPGSRPIELIRPIPDRQTYQRLVEGAWVIYRNGWYYLFYSGDNCCGEGAHYAAMVARSRSATGPFQTLAEATGRTESTILERRDHWIAPGHNSIIRDAAGEDWIFYHAIDPNRRFMDARIEGDRDTRRVMLMDRVIYRGGWPQIAGGQPSVARQRAPVTQRIARRSTSR